MQPAGKHLVEVWAHPQHLREEVRRRAREHACHNEINIQEKGPVLVERGSLLQVRLRVDGAAVSPKQETILWLGEIANARFVVTLPVTAKPGENVSGRVVVYCCGGVLTNLSFVLRVEAATSAPDFLDTSEVSRRRAFASYASRDEDAVLGRIQGMKKALPHLDVFYARASLGSGERWKKRLQDEILHRDIFYLFWSLAAKHSRWVRWEWNLALSERGIDYIDPVPLVSPQIVPPPPELAGELHFDDWVLAFMSSNEMT